MKKTHLQNTAARANEEYIDLNEDPFANPFLQDSIFSDTTCTDDANEDDALSAAIKAL